MSKVIKSDLEATLQSISLLNADISDSQNLIQQLNNFYNAHEFKGMGYDYAKRKALGYIEIINIMMSLGENLLNAISVATSNFINFMEEYSELDSSKLDELRNEFHRLEKCYNACKYNLYLLNSGQANSSSDESIEYYKNSMNTYSVLMKDIQKLIFKLEELTSVDNSLYGEYIQPVLTGVVNCSGQVNSINVSSIKL